MSPLVKFGMIRRIAAATLALIAITTVHAQSVKPLRIIVPYGPGGTGDVIARLVAQQITLSTGQAVIVDNRAGGGGVIGATAVASAEPDGSTLLLGYTSELVISPTLVKGVRYSVDKDFTPVAFGGATPLLLIANNNVPGTTVSEFIAAAKAKPKDYSYATAGNGSPAHIAGALLASISGAPLLGVPYKGGAPAVTDVLAGNVSIFFSGMPPAVGLVRSGKVKALGVTSRTASPALPNVPPLAMTYPDLDLSGWFGFLAPAKTPPEVVAGLNAKISAVLQSSAVQAKLLEQGVETRAMSPAEFGKFIQGETAKYDRLIKALNIQSE